MASITGSRSLAEGSKLTPWPFDDSPTEAALDRLLRAEGLAPRWWSNGPGDRYEPHEHAYHKVLYCASGAITFRFEGGGESVTLRPGDRLDVPPGAVHSATVGPSGCSCVEAARQG